MTDARNLEARWDALAESIERLTHEHALILRQNEVLRAKVETMELMARLLHAHPGHLLEGASEDLVSRVNTQLGQMRAAMGEDAE